MEINMEIDMSDTCPTVIIERDGQSVVINLEDFDPKSHKIAKVNELAPSDTVAKVIGEPVWKIGKNGKRGAASKFVIIDPAGNVMPEEYDTEEAARAVLTNLTAESAV